MALAVLVGAIALLAWAVTSGRSPEQRQQAARDLLAGVHVRAAVVSLSLAATSAIADFGGKGGVHLVGVRIVDQLHLQVRIETDRGVTLAGPPTVCLVGPYSAPDDVGLSDRCWGEPDLGTLVAASLPVDAAGHSVLRPASPTVLEAALSRGQVRCDYPPGAWRLEIAAVPLMDGSAIEPIDLPALVFDVPYQNAAPLPALPINRTRYCGLANAVYQEQGEPVVASP